MKTKFIFYFFSFVLTLSSCKNPFSNNIDDPTILIKKYLASKTWQERLIYVLDSAQVKPIMEEYYEKSDFSKQPYLKDIKQIPKNKDFNLPDSVILMSITASWKNAFGGEVSDQFYYYLVKTENGLKINWPSSIGFNLLSLDVYKATKPNDIKTFKLTCKLSDYFNYGYSDSGDQYYSIDCETSENGSFSSIYGYVQKESEDGIKMFELLKDGKKHKMTLSLQYDYKSEGNSEISTIRKFITEGWYFNESSALVNPEELSDYFPSEASIWSYQGFPDQAESNNQFITISSTQFVEGDFIISTNNMNQGNSISEIKEYCTFTNETLEVFRIISNSIIGKTDQAVHKILVKLPMEDKATYWKYNDSDGTNYTYSSEFTSLVYKGKQTKAIKVTEKNSAFTTITTYRYYLKGIGLYKESQEDKKGIVITTLQLR